MQDVNNNARFSGMKKITEVPNGSVHECPPTWTGVLAMLLRKIVKDDFDGKGVDGVIQYPDESLTYPQLTEMVQNMHRAYNPNIDDKEVKSMVSYLMKELSIEAISIKYLGEFLHLLDLEWVDITLVLGRKSGTIKSYTKHIGGIGINGYDKPTYNQQHFAKYKTHEEQVTLLEPSAILSKLKGKENGKQTGTKSRKSKNQSD